jgi:hypothetical protein
MKKKFSLSTGAPFVWCRSAIVSIKSPREKMSEEEDGHD